MKRLFLIMILAGSITHCYKGDPGYGNTNYPPDDKQMDAGRD